MLDCVKFEKWKIREVLVQERKGGEELFSSYPDLKCINFHQTNCSLVCFVQLIQAFRFWFEMKLKCLLLKNKSSSDERILLRLFFSQFDLRTQEIDTL